MSSNLVKRLQTHVAVIGTGSTSGQLCAEALNTLKTALDREDRLCEQLQQAAVDLDAAEVKSETAREYWQGFYKAKLDAAEARERKLREALEVAACRFELIALGSSVETANPEVGALEARQALTETEDQNDG